MLLPSPSLLNLYNQILKTSLRPTSSNVPPSPVQIILTPSLDSIATLRILTFMLRNDRVPYKINVVGDVDGFKYVVKGVFPVWGQRLEVVDVWKRFGRGDVPDDMIGNNNKNNNAGASNNNEDGEDDDNEFVTDTPLSLDSLQTFVLINIGADLPLPNYLPLPSTPTHLLKPNTTIDITKTTQYSSNNSSSSSNSSASTSVSAYINTYIPPSTLRVFVLDSNRPINLKNVYCGIDEVCVVCSEFEGEEELKGFLDGSGSVNANTNDSDDEDGDSGRYSGIVSEGEGMTDGELGESESESESESDEDGDDDEGETEFVDEDEDDAKKDKYKDDDDDDEKEEGESDSDSDGEKVVSKRRKIEDDDDDDNDKDDKDDKDEDADLIESASNPQEESTTADTNNENNDDDDDNDDKEEEEEELPPAPPPTPARLTLKDRASLRRKNLTLYYTLTGHSHSPPTSSLIYFNLVKTTRYKNNSDLLWLAIVGVHEGFIMGRIDGDEWYGFCGLFGNGEIPRVFSPETLKLDGIGGGFSTVKGPATKITTSSEGLLIYDYELKFHMLRHQSLYAAMYFSPYLHSFLRLHVGKESASPLLGLFAMCGIPLTEAKQHYGFMNVTVKADVKSTLIKHWEDTQTQAQSSNPTPAPASSTHKIHAISNDRDTSNEDDMRLTTPGFLRVTGYKSLISSADVVYAVLGLLEREISVNGGFKEGLNEVFWEACDAMNFRSKASSDSDATSGGSGMDGIVTGEETSSSGLSLGLTLGMGNMKQVVYMAQRIIEQQMIVSYKHFRFAYIHCSSHGNNSTSVKKTVSGNGNGKGGASGTNRGNESKNNDTNIFSTHYPLTRLAHLLIDIHRVKKPSAQSWLGVKRSKPLLLISEIPNSSNLEQGSDGTGTSSSSSSGSNYYLIIAYTCLDTPHTIVSSKFPSYFMQCAQLVGDGVGKTGVVLDKVYGVGGGDCVRVVGSKVGRFVECLHSIMEV